MNRTSRLIYAESFVIVGAGFLVPLWPLCACGILLAALSGRWVFATAEGLLIDIAWGAPGGLLHYVYFPFTVVALVAALMYMAFSSYFVDRTPTDTLWHSA